MKWTIHHANMTEFTYKLIRRLLVGHSISWKYLPIACWVTVFPLHFSDYSRIHESIGKKRLITTGCISRGNSRLKTHRIYKTYSLSHYIVEWKEIEMAWPSSTISLSYLYRPFWYTDRTALSFSLRLFSDIHLVRVFLFLFSCCLCALQCFRLNATHIDAFVISPSINQFRAVWLFHVRSNFTAVRESWIQRQLRDMRWIARESLYFGSNADWYHARINPYVFDIRSLSTERTIWNDAFAPITIVELIAFVCGIRHSRDDRMRH